jgi:uncharacterized membrane protein
MAIDHVRVYSGLPAGGPDPGIFFTRWVTHFCAPVFVFLAGTSAFLYNEKLGDLRKLQRYLVSRGLLLVILELTLIRFGWTFNFKYDQFVLAGVIWMIGWCMVLMALLVRLRPVTVGIIGLVIIFFQNVFAYLPTLLPEAARNAIGPIWEFIYSSGLPRPAYITILYVLVPWIGVMAAGYGFGTILRLEEARRNRILITIGLAATLLFLVWGAVYLNPREGVPFYIQLLNQNKYPASQLFLLMTLGPSILIMPLVDKSQNALTRFFIVFGRVPFFYYLLHIPLIHVSALLVQFLSVGSIPPGLYDTAPYTRIPQEYRWNLLMLYVVFIIDVILLYFPCRWFQDYKLNHPEKSWLRFI